MFFRIFVEINQTRKTWKNRLISASAATVVRSWHNSCLTPKAAYRKLVGWIDHYPGLAVRLAELGKLPGSRSYTPAQVREIVGALGEP